MFSKSRLMPLYCRWPETRELTAEGLAGCRIVEQARDVHPLVGGGIEVVDQGQNFGVRLFKSDQRHHFVVNRLDAAVLNDVVQLVQLVTHLILPSFVVTCSHSG